MSYREIELEELAAARLGRRILYFDELPSTNSYVKENYSSLLNGDTVIAEFQSSGRGRRGHSWEALPGQSLAMSVVLRGESDMQKLSLLPHCAGLSAAEAMEHFTGITSFLKWPNDVLMSGKKICGILCETLVTEETVTAVIGIGVNLAQEQEFFDRCGLTNGSSLKLLGADRADALTVAAEILKRLEKNIDALFAYGFGGLRQKYTRRCINIGRTVRVMTDAGQRVGTAADVDENGNLLVDFGGFITPVYYGEASVRGIDGYF